MGPVSRKTLHSICLVFNGDSYPNKGDTGALNGPSVLDSTAQHDIQNINTNTSTYINTNTNNTNTNTNTNVNTNANTNTNTKY